MPNTESILRPNRVGEPPLLVHEVSKVYPNGLRANDNIDLEVWESEVVGLIGPNGAGKTTLIRQILGLLAPTDGKITVLGRTLPDEAEQLRGRIGFVPQMPLQYPSLTPLELVSAIVMMRGSSRRDARARAMKHLSDVGLEKEQDSYGYQLSYGSIKLMNLAMALCQEPKLLILDEPTSMVDVVNRRRVRSLISSLKDCCVLLSSHDLSEVQSVCDRSYVIAGGCVIAEGTPTQLAELFSETTHLRVTVPEGEEVRLVLNGVKRTNHEQGASTYTFSSLPDALDALSTALERGIHFKEVRLSSPSFEESIRQLLEDTRCE